MSIGIFDNHADIGAVLRSGNAEYDAATRRYRVAGSGENMWFTCDAFHYVWKEARGDVALTADISFPEPGREPHRKACLVIRQSLDAGSAYADAALHGDGLTSLQFRDTQGGTTHEVQANVSAPARLRIEKRGDYVLLFLADAVGKIPFSGAATRLPLQEPFYVGLGVCSHNNNVTETAAFSDVVLDTDLSATSSAEQPVLYSVLETQLVSSTDRRVCYVTPTHIEAPNWLADGSALIFNSGGRIHRIPVAGGTPQTIETGFAMPATTTTAFRPTGPGWSSAISRRNRANRSSTRCPSPVECPDGSRPPAHRTGIAGRPTARH